MRGRKPDAHERTDEISGIVLHNVKIPSEKAESIIPFLENIKATMGTPLSAVSDMSTGIASAVRELFPGVHHFLCHFHFLRDIGKDLLGADYDTLRRGLKTHGLKTELRALAKKCQVTLDRDPTMKASLERYVQHHTAAGRTSSEALPAVVSVYILALWVINAKLSSTGHGFPFDRPHLALYERLSQVGDLFAKKTTLHSKHRYLASLKQIVNEVLHDQPLERAVNRLIERAQVFDRLREVMRIATQDSKKALNDNGDTVSMTTIEEALTAFRTDKEIAEKAASERAYEKMLKQIDKHWEKLFAAPITVCTPQGERVIQPQRTNNSLERFFRSIKRTLRRKSGCHSLTKVFQAILADTPLIKNLEKREYMTILLNDKTSLEERFADINEKKIREYFSALDDTNAPYRITPRMKKLLRRPNLPQLLRVKPLSRSPA